MTHEACESKLRSVVRSSMHPYPGKGWQSGVRSCIMPGLPANLVQELNVGTVVMSWSISSFKQVTHCLMLERQRGIQV